MKHIFLLTLLMLASIIVTAQTHTETFVACDSSYSAICDLKNTNKIKVSIIKGSDDSTKVQYTIVTNDLDVFAKVFKQKFNTLTSNGCADSTKILSYARLLFFNFKAANEADTLKPIAGLLSVKDSVALRMEYFGKDSNRVFDSSDDSIKLKIKKITAEVNDGFIENIKAYVETPNGIRYFTIAYPIGMSSIANFKKYNSDKLIDFGSDFFLQKNKKKLRSKDSLKSSRHYYILLGDVIDYDYYFGVDRRDYSPKNMVLDIKGGESMVLQKEETSKLFEAHIFTDFVGLKEDKPNGLIQTTVSKRINTNTKQHSAPWAFYWLYKSYGGFQYICPTITISKLEDHNKQLILGNLDSIRATPGLTDTSKFRLSTHRFLNGLDLYQHQSFSAGFDVNFLYLNNHDLKYNLYLNGGIRLGITPVRDSLTGRGAGNLSKTGFVNDYSINTLQFSPQVILNFLPEERFNLSLSEKFIYIKPLDQNVQVFSIDKVNSDKWNAFKASYLNVAELLMTIQINKATGSKLFGRVIFNSDWKNIYNNFAQLQIGYSTFILGNK